MRWFAPIVIVAIVAAGASRPAHAGRSIERVSISDSSCRRAAATLRDLANAAKLAPRRVLSVRGAVSDRRADHDEVFVVPRTVELLAIPVIVIARSHVVHAPLPTLSRVVPIARGPPSRVVPFHSPH